jgi:PAS domain S-box-containing protein
VFTTPTAPAVGPPEPPVGERRRTTLAAPPSGLDGGWTVVPRGPPTVDRWVASGPEGFSPRASRDSMLSASDRRVLQDFPTMVWYCGPDAPELEWVNATWTRFTGRCLEQERGLGLLEGIHPDDRERVLSAFVAHYERREPYELEYRMRRHDGVHRTLFELGRPLRTEAGGFGGYLGACYDVTDRREAIDALEASDAMQRLIVQTLFHDLAGPLASAMAATDLLRARLRGDEDVERILGLLDEQQLRMQRLLRELRHLDQAEHGEVDGRATRVELDELVEDVLAGVALGDRPLHRELVPMTVEVDAVLLRRALDNLVRNAATHTPAGTDVWVRTELVGGRPRITVDDDGAGLPPDHEPLFAPYRRGDDDGDTSGLGLSIARRYVEAIGGTLEADDRPGGGARFVIGLPAATVVRSELSGQGVAAATASTVPSGFARFG